MQPEDHGTQGVPDTAGEQLKEVEQTLAQRKEPYRPPYTLIAWLAPIVTPLGFALLVWTRLVRYGTKLATGLLGTRVVGDPMLMFMWGWIGLTVVCAGWIAWRSSRRRRGAMRVLIFLLVWPAAAVVLGVAGGAIGWPACMAAER